MKFITNPILTGFNPDPSICRVGEDYYIATSTFEWFPGVQIHHSRDLVNWRLLTRPLTRLSQLDLRGRPCSGGVWAPALSYADGLFWLIYTDVRTHTGLWKDCHNYLVTAPAICGPWSDPIYLNSSGFDPSLFHDSDGRKWLVNMRWEHLPGEKRFSGIVLQEYDVEGQCLTGPVHSIFAGTELNITEGPHLYRRNGWYYLMTAEGGTSITHAVTLARSRSLTGPYEVHPQNPILTSAGNPKLELWKAGHGSLCETPAGEWYMAHLCARPHQHEGASYCMLGRETALQAVHWDDDDWLRLTNGGNEPEVKVAAPALPAHPWPETPARDDFDKPELSIDWQSLRAPVTNDWLSLSVRPGWLRLYGRESLNSLFDQSLLARRIQHQRGEVRTLIDFQPCDSQQMAGLTAFYNLSKWFYLAVGIDSHGCRELQLLQSDNDGQRFLLQTPVTASGSLELRLTFAPDALQFYYRSAGGELWHPMGTELPAWKLSDEYGTGFGFTGTFVGLACQDLSGLRVAADFDWFEYETSSRSC